MRGGILSIIGQRRNHGMPRIPLALPGSSVNSVLTKYLGAVNIAWQQIGSGSMSSRKSSHWQVNYDVPSPVCSGFGTKGKKRNRQEENFEAVEWRLIRSYWCLF